VAPKMEDRRFVESRELRLFVEAPAEGGFRLVAPDGSVILERPTYERLRRDAMDAIGPSDGAPLRLTVLVGGRRRKPEPRLLVRRR
jgi:hypothetical protein